MVFVQRSGLCQLEPTSQLHSNDLCRRTETLQLVTQHTAYGKHAQFPFVPGLDKTSIRHLPSDPAARFIHTVTLIRPIALILQHIHTNEHSTEHFFTQR